MRAFLLCTLLSTAAFAPSAMAEGIFGSGNTLDPAFCKQHTVRQTVVYIDDSILVAGNTEWARTIYAKLRATLTPGERTTLVELSPTTGGSTEMWSGCWPAYTPAQSARLASETHIFSANPLNSIGEQQGYFFHDFGVAAQKIEQKAARPASAVMIDPASPPSKSVLRTLVSDGARYAHTRETVRAILYSDLAENSDLGSVFKPLPAAPVDYGAQLGTYLRRSVFYVFGLGSDMHGQGALQDTTRHFWDNALRSMNATVASFGSDLGVPNILPVREAAYDVTLQDAGQTLPGHLSLLADADGTLVDSWIGITRLRNATLNGVYRCNGPADALNCMLNATSSGGVVTMSPSENVHLAGRDGQSLKGHIGVPGSNVNLALTANPATD
ncbi:hypothetical protein AA101099_2162 [Neoasaia chiangmaiensis NBRC 101099]|uniref:Uncharacterized protein n=1 Tax=Neoasaia chiangmaiensis TaxID=320497 RepID=A0A1U9KSP2_9PROT|nr:hypothetical protein [Neoasaia chiangmaiensis]AQS88864.1 hypothetical protein A0U93_14110 [Neoasaia chiangmaiensis]GBR40542.1 hypothetical protein AA101099_2162 [Neoasaia chiangmaiensis NBRC 101099]GEN13850.1 hypothetical protein NCH01_02810 [Neoasaia chiangmaiensis]